MSISSSFRSNSEVGFGRPSWPGIQPIFSCAPLCAHPIRSTMSIVHPASYESSAQSRRAYVSIQRSTLRHRAHKYSYRATWVAAARQFSPFWLKQVHPWSVTGTLASRSGPRTRLYIELCGVPPYSSNPFAFSHQLGVCSHNEEPSR
jgi:hypothetical protein